MPLYAGFDLGGTQLKYGVIDERGKTVIYEKTDSPTRSKDLFILLKKLWESLKRNWTGIEAVGLGIPGIFSQKEQKIFQSPNYPELDNLELVPPLSQFIEVPFWVNNDANMAAFGEYKYGAGQDAQSMILLTIGTGVGGGIILNEKLWQGKCGFAGELGHITVHPHGEKCNCGGQGCLETEVSAQKIVQNYNSFKKKNEKISAEEVFLRGTKGDPDARNAFALAGFYLGIGLSIAINFLNPEKIILGGGVMDASDFLLPTALEEARKRSYQASFMSCSIEKATLGNKAGFIGAASWAKEQIGS